MPNYSEGFKNRVKAEFPDNPYNIFESMEKGSDFVGRVLDDSQGRLDVKTVKTLAKAGDTQSIVDLCEKIERRGQLYSDWYKERGR